MTNNSRSLRLDNGTVPIPSGDATTRKTDRIEAFSDAVLAIAITLPIVELHAPEVGPNGDLAAELAKLWPSYLSYALSFAVIGIYWGRSHFLGKIVEKTDHLYNLLNLLFLASVTVLPLPTRVFVNHIQGDGNSKVAGVIYASSLLLPTLVWTIKWFYAAKYHLLDVRLTDEYLQWGKKAYVATTAGLALSVAVTLVSWRLGVALAGLITLAYLLPPKTPQYKPGQEPKDEMEEAEDRPREQAT